jgi:hypothetical protein
MEMCLKETQSQFSIGKYLSDVIAIHISLRQEDALSPLLFNFASEYAIRESK